MLDWRKPEFIYIKTSEMMCKIKAKAYSNYETMPTFLTLTFSASGRRWWRITRRQVALSSVWWPSPRLARSAATIWN